MANKLTGAYVAAWVWIPIEEGIWCLECTQGKLWEQDDGSLLCDHEGCECRLEAGVIPLDRHFQYTARRERSQDDYVEFDEGAAVSRSFE